MDLPILCGKVVRPSGLFPFPRSNPTGSSWEANPATPNARFTIPLMALCPRKRPSLHLHDNGWKHILCEKMRVKIENCSKYICTTETATPKVPQKILTDSPAIFKRRNSTAHSWKKRNKKQKTVDCTITKNWLKLKKKQKKYYVNRLSQQTNYVWNKTVPAVVGIIVLTMFCCRVRLANPPFCRTAGSVGNLCTPFRLWHPVSPVLSIGSSLHQIPIKLSYIIHPPSLRFTPFSSSSICYPHCGFSGPPIVFSTGQVSGPVPLATLHCLGQIFTPCVCPHPTVLWEHTAASMKRTFISADSASQKINGKLYYGNVQVKLKMKMLETLFIINTQSLYSWNSYDIANYKHHRKLLILERKYSVPRIGR
ncbi:hypothetical protein GQR58_025102 [Nymphon striatum]|nr:hypothetical protein GQR58_025102 [Nymphon striatum]